MVCCMIFKSWICVLSTAPMNFLSSLPLCGIFPLHFLASRYDESSPHPYIRAGWTHGASQGQRQPQALTGIWGECGQRFKAQSFFWVLISVWLCFHCKGTQRVPLYHQGNDCFSPFKSFFPLLFDNIVADGASAITKYQLCSAAYFPRYNRSLNMAKQDNCHFQWYKFLSAGCCNSWTPKCNFLRFFAK